MFNKFIILIMLLCGPFAEPVWASDSNNPASVISAAIPRQVSNIPERGTLYRVRYQEHTSYLFGTIHVGQTEFFPLEKQATQALAEASTLALELDMRNTVSIQRAVQKYGVYAGNDTLDKHLSSTSLIRLKQALAQADIPFDNVAHLKAWMAADVLTIATLEHQGYHSEQGIDTFLLKSAVAQGKAIQELESADFQMSLFNNMTEKQQEKYLNENLDDIQSGIALKQTKELVNAWATADEKAFNGLLRKAQNDNSTSGTFIRRALLDKRNPTMASRIEALLKQDKASFVGIGLLHLIGKDGVPQLLSRRGYEVTRLY